MKQKLLLCAIIVFFTSFVHAQTNEQYRALVNEAWRLYEMKDYPASGQKYADAFAANGNMGIPSDRYNAACSWALAGNSAAAFEQLFKIARNANYSKYDHLLVDTDLNSLHNDPQWQEVLSLVKANKDKAEAGLDKPLVATLDSIFREDQMYRMQTSDVEKQYGRNSEQMKAHYKKMNDTDSINLLRIQRILDTRGWLGADVIGEQGNTTLFLVIQHANLQVQEKYLPMLRDAVQKGKAKAADLALMEDRVALRKGNKQIYGSQIGRDPGTGAWYVSPLEDPDHVDERRAKVGLAPMATYLMHWDLKWDVEAYKKQLPEIEAKRKQ